MQANESITGEIVLSEAEQKQILMDAIQHYGVSAQRLMLFEEMAELQNVICKGERKRAIHEEIAEEVADVLIMLGQTMIMYNCEDEVKELIQYKLRRLKKRIEGEADAFSDLPFC